MKLNYHEGIKRITSIAGVSLSLFFMVLFIFTVVDGSLPNFQENFSFSEVKNEMEMIKFFGCSGDATYGYNRGYIWNVYKCPCEASGITAYYKCNVLKHEMVITFIAALLSFPLLHTIRLIISFIILYISNGFASGSR